MTPPRGIVVIGAGIVGCSIAYELARRGATVHVVEARAPGMGASQAAAGILAPHVEIRSHAAFLELAVRSLSLFDDFVARVQTDSAMTVGYRRTGTLQVAATEDGMCELASVAARLEAGGIAARLLHAQAVRAEEPQLGTDAVGGLLLPMHGFVSAGVLVRALAAAARRHGARIDEGRAVRRVASDGEGLSVEADGGTLTASAVVLAAGSWSACLDIVGVAPLPVRPVRGQLLRLAWKGTPLRRVVWGPRCYLVPWDDGTLLVGATEEDAGFDERSTVAGVRDLLDAACEIVPAAWSAGFLETRAGLRPATTDRLPIVGPSHVLPQLMYATAHYRNGILLAPLTAALVADALLDGRFDPMLTLLGPQRFGNL